MIPFISLSGHAYICASHIQSVCEHEVSPMFIDTHNCELIVTTFTTRSSVTLSNGMELYSNRSYQELASAMTEASQQAPNFRMPPVAVSDRITVDPAYIVAILPYNSQLYDFVEDYDYQVYPACKAPRCLIVMENEICLAVEATPAELVEMLSKPPQA